MPYQDLRDFTKQLEKLGELKRIAFPVSPYLEMTEICDRTLRAAGPALLFENGPSMPVLGNLFGTTRRVALAMGMETEEAVRTDAECVEALRKMGQFLAELREPPPLQSWRDAWDKLPMLKQILNMAPKIVKNPPCQNIVWRGQEVDLGRLPIQHCWPDDVAPLITWGLVVTRGPTKKRQNMGIYRQQLLDRHKVIMRWLPHRGGALDFRDHAQHYLGCPFPMSVVLGCDPATLLSAVMPIPDVLSEHQFAGLLRGAKTELSICINSDLQVPARAEIVLEGHIYPDMNSPTGYEQALEGPHGDHTGYYNETECFPVFTIDCITLRENPIYLSTYTGRPPDEPAVLGRALNDVFVPILQKQFPEIIDFYLPPEGCSYRLAVVSIKKQYPGHAKRVMFGIWSFLRQFMYTKWIVVVDDDINVRDWPDVIWAMTTCMDPARDTTMVDHTPIDYLDFASPISGLGSKIGLDATSKWPGETTRKWGKKMKMDPSVVARVDAMWDQLGL